MKTVIRGALAAAFVGAAGASALAADLPYTKAPPPPPPVVEEFQPFQVRLKIGGVVPLAGKGTTYDEYSAYPIFGLAGAPSVTALAGLGGPGLVIPNASTSTSWSVIPMLDVSYYITKNWAIETICCVSQNHIQGTGEIASTFAHTWVFPPSLIAQYHFTQFGPWQPYLGVGVNFTTYWGTRVNNEGWALDTAPGSTLAGLGIPFVNASFYSATVTPSWGVVGQAGLDYMFNEHWGVNLDVKYIMMEPIVHAKIVAYAPTAPGLGAIYIPVKVALPIDPLVISAGVTYRFGGHAAAPVFAKY